MIKFDYDKDKKQFTLESEIKVSRPISEVFKFFSDPKNLELLTPPFLRFHVVAPEDINMKAGAKINYQLSLYGVPFHWTSVISKWDPPYAFVDEQVRGPYRYWIHQHLFRSEGDNATVISDKVRYNVHGGPIVERFFVRKDLTKIFSYRSKKIEELFS